MLVLRTARGLLKQMGILPFTQNQTDFEKFSTFVYQCILWVFLIVNITCIAQYALENITDIREVTQAATVLFGLTKALGQFWFGLSQRWMLTEVLNQLETLIKTSLYIKCY